MNCLDKAMNFLYIEFVKPSGHFDIVSPVVNLIGSSLVVAVGGTSLAVVSYVALKALGFGNITTGLVTAIPVSLAACGAVVAGTLTFGIGWLLYQLFKKYTSE